MSRKNYLSKSDFLKYQTCPQYLWLWKNKKEVVPTDNPEDIERRIEQGNEVEGYARLLFPQGVLAEGRFKEAETNTKRLLKLNTEYIFQATVVTKSGLLAMADVLHDNSDGTFDILEVKSTTEIKKDHLIDTTFQLAAFTEAGFKINKVYLIYLNKDYKRFGEIKPKELFVVEDVSDRLNELLPDIKIQLSDALDYIEKKDEPKTCSCRLKTKSKHCPTFKYFNPDIPDYSVYNLSRIGNKSLGELIDMEVLNIHDIPEDFKLTEKQQNQVTVAKLDQPLIYPDKIQEELSVLKYPLYFLDYETISTAIPMFDGCWPYQQVPFQYSLHVLRTPESELEHYEFLARDNKENPIPDLLKQMSSEIGPDGSVIVWYKPFETSRNKEMGKSYEEYNKFLLSVNDRVYDLMDVFSKQYHVHPKFLGKTSIKYVLPVLIPELSYKELDIQNGGVAALRWYQMATGSVEYDDQEKIYADLLKYCCLDTLAMYKIFEHLTLVQ
jgi:CRISPR/Cas system-associated exonuclease Cas4 (RecB family)